jgi:hypothetical protein
MVGGYNLAFYNNKKETFFDSHNDVQCAVHMAKTKSRDRHLSNDEGKSVTL